MAAVQRHYCSARDTIMSRPSNRHRQFDINLTSNTGCNRWASGHHKRALILESLVTPPEEPPFEMAAVPLFHHLAQKQSCPGFNRHHHPATETGYSRCSITHPCRLEACSHTLAVSHWHTTKTWTSSFTQLPPSTCPRKPPPAKRAKCGLPADGTHSWCTRCTTFTESTQWIEMEHGH